MASKVDDVRTLDALRELVHDGAEPEYLLFYGHTPLRSGRINASCLSQWWRAEFVVDGERYFTAEHFMMASKAELFGDHEMAARIREEPEPKAAKVLGREVAGFESGTWERQRFDIVLDGNVAKFGQHRDLRAYLLSTGNKVIVEASKTDLVWGSGVARGEKNATKPDYWRGQNLLGFALMEVREQLRA